MKKNGRKSMVLRVPRSNDGRLFENLFQQFLNREVFSFRKKKASGGHDHYYLSVVGDKGRSSLGGHLLERLDFIRKAFNSANDRSMKYQRKLVFQVALNEQFLRQVKALQGKARGFDQLSGLLNFVDGLGPDTVKGVGLFVDYARAFGLMQKPEPNGAHLDPPKVEDPQHHPGKVYRAEDKPNGKL